MRQTITIAAGLQELPRLAAWAEASAPGFGLSERQIYAIQLCLEEVAINLVLHAQPASPHLIQVTVSLEGSPPAPDGGG